MLERHYQGDPIGAVTALRALLELDDPPSAIFSSNSQGSLALVPELQASGRTELAFVSFGDFPMAAALRPSVTVLDQNPENVGLAAAERLFARIDGLRAPRKRHLVLPVPLVVRDSSPIVAPKAPAANPPNAGKRNK